MNLVKVLAIIVAFGHITFALADVTIKFEENVSILAVNQEKPDTKRGGLFSSSQSVTMPNGENQIVFRYQPFFENGIERETINSQVIIAKFNAVDTKLTLKVPTFRDAESATAGIDPLNWSLVNDSGQKTKHVEDVLVKEGVQFGRNFSNEAKDYNRKGGIAALPVAVPIAPTQQLQVVQAPTQTQVPAQVKAPTQVQTQLPAAAIAVE
ncbi:MAG: DUF2057 family protein, partial [Pseudomonadota bacterium]